jgi:hypothetical protein
MAKPGRALGPLLAVLLIAAPAATADIGVVRVNPKVASPGERVDLEVGCGGCHGGSSFPVSLIPVAKAPRLRPCNGDAVCLPDAARPLDGRSAVLLGATSAETRSGPVAKSDLNFAVPRIAAGRYAFVIFCEGCVSGPQGGLIADTRPGQLLQVVPGEASSGSGGGGDATWWVLGGIGAIGLALAAVLLLRRRRAA